MPAKPERVAVFAYSHPQLPEELVEKHGVNVALVIGDAVSPAIQWARDNSVAALEVDSSRLGFPKPNGNGFMVSQILGSWLAQYSIDVTVVPDRIRFEDAVAREYRGWLLYAVEGATCNQCAPGDHSIVVSYDTLYRVLDGDLDPAECRNSCA